MSEYCSICTVQIPHEKTEESADGLGTFMCEACRKDAAVANVPIEVMMQIDGVIPPERIYGWWVSGHELLGGLPPAWLWQDGGPTGQRNVIAFIESAKSGDMC